MCSLHVQLQIRETARTGKSPKNRQKITSDTDVLMLLFLNKASDELTTERRHWHGGRLLLRNPRKLKKSNRSQDEPLMNSTAGNPGLRAKIATDLLNDIRGLLKYDDSEWQR